jgi:formate dehydrogenase maturation protein FdhE
VTAYREKYRSHKGGWCETKEKEYRRQWQLKKRYGLTTLEVEAMRKSQGGLCAICRQKPRRFVVDHCHASGHVRGLLCNHCNSGLAMFRDNQTSMRSAIKYLRLAALTAQKGSTNE